MVNSLEAWATTAVAIIVEAGPATVETVGLVEAHGTYCASIAETSKLFLVVVYLMLVSVRLFYHFYF